MQGISKIKKIQPIANIQPISNIQPIQYNYRYNKNPISTVANYNDPFEINSIADVILTSFQTGKNNKMKTKYNKGLLGVPVVNILPRYFEYLNKFTVEPIKQGNWGAAGLNILTGGMETLDVLANPFKAFFQGENPLDALGWGTEGRKNYDWDTGNMVADIALEILSDPMTYVGSPGIWKSSLKWMNRASVAGVVQDALGDVGEKWLKEIGEESAGKYLRKLVSRSINLIVNGEADTVLEGIAKAAQKAGTKGHTIRRFMNMDLPEAVLRGLKNLADETIDDTSIKILQSTLEGVSKQARIISKFEKLDDTVTGLGFFGAAGISSVWYGGRAIKSAIDYADRRIDRALRPFIREAGTLSFSDYKRLSDAYNGRVGSLNKALKRSGLTNDYQGRSLTYLLSRNAAADILEIRTVVHAAKNNPADIVSKIDDHMIKRHGVSLSEYINDIKVVNAQADNAFSDVEEHFKIVSDLYDTAKQAVTDAETALKLHKEIDEFDAVTKVLESIEALANGAVVTKHPVIDGVLRRIAGKQYEFRHTAKYNRNSDLIEMAIDDYVKKHIAGFMKRSAKIGIEIPEATVELRKTAFKMYRTGYNELYKDVVYRLVKSGRYNPELHNTPYYHTFVENYVLDNIDEFLNTGKVKFNDKSFKKTIADYGLQKFDIPEFDARAILETSKSLAAIREAIEQLPKENDILNNLYDEVFESLVEATNAVIKSDGAITKMKDTAKLNDNVIKLKEAFSKHINSLTKNIPSTGQDLKQTIKTMDSIDTTGAHFQGAIMDILQRYVKRTYSEGFQKDLVDWAVLKAEHQQLANEVFQFFEGTASEFSNIENPTIMDVLEGAIAHWDFTLKVPPLTASPETQAAYAYRLKVNKAIKETLAHLKRVEKYPENSLITDRAKQVINQHRDTLVGVINEHLMRVLQPDGSWKKVGLSRFGLDHKKYDFVRFTEKELDAILAQDWTDFSKPIRGEVRIHSEKATNLFNQVKGMGVAFEREQINTFRDGARELLNSVGLRISDKRLYNALDEFIQTNDVEMFKNKLLHHIQEYYRSHLLQQIPYFATEAKVPKTGTLTWAKKALQDFKPTGVPEVDNAYTQLRAWYRLATTKDLNGFRELSAGLNKLLDTYEHSRELNIFFKGMNVEMFADRDQSMKILQAILDKFTVAGNSNHNKKIYGLMDGVINPELNMDSLIDWFDRYVDDTVNMTPQSLYESIEAFRLANFMLERADDVPLLKETELMAAYTDLRNKLLVIRNNLKETKLGKINAKPDVKLDKQMLDWIDKTVTEQGTLPTYRGDLIDALTEGVPLNGEALRSYVELLESTHSDTLQNFLKDKNALRKTMERFKGLDTTHSKRSLKGGAAPTEQVRFQIDEMLERLSEFDVIKYQRLNVTATAGDIIYAGKLEQAYISTIFLQSGSEAGTAIEELVTNNRGGLSEYVHRYAAFDTASEAFEQLSDADKEMVRLAKDTLRNAKGLIDYREFVHRLNATPTLSQQTKDAVLSVVQKWARKRLRTIEDGFENFLDAVIDQIETYGSSKEAKRAYGLDVLRGAYPETPDAWAALKPGDFWYDVQKMLPSGTKLSPEMAHRSDFDNLTTMWLYENLLKRQALPGQWYMDMETTGKDAVKHSVLDITFTNHDGSDSIKFKINLDEDKNFIAPQDQVMRIWEDIATDPTTRLNNLRKHYSKTANTDADAAHTVVWCDSQDDMMQKVGHFLHSQKTPDSTLIIQNGEKFDKPFLQQALRNTGRNEALINDWKLIDTLKEMKAVDNAYSVSLSERETIRRIFDSYLSTRHLNGGANLKFIDSINLGLIDNLQDLSRLIQLDADQRKAYVKLTNSLDSARKAGDDLTAADIKEQIDTFAQGLSLTSAEAAEAYTLAKNMKIILSEEVKKVNKQLRGFVFSKKVLEEPEFLLELRKGLLELLTAPHSIKDTDEFINTRRRTATRILDTLKKAYPEEFKSTLSNFDTGKAIERALDKWLTHQNLGKIFYGMTEGINQYGFKKVADFNAMGTWFDIPEGMQMDAVISSKFQDIANRLGRNYDNIKNVEVLREHEQAIDELLEIYLKAEGLISNPAWSYFRTEDMDFVSKYVMVEYLHKQIRYKSLNLGQPDYLATQLNKTGVTEELLSLLDLLDDTTILYHPLIPEKGLTNVQYVATLDYDKQVFKPGGLKQLSYNLSKSIDNLNMLADDMETLEVFKPSVRRLSLGLMPMDNLLKQFNDWYGQLPYGVRSKVFNLMNDAQDVTKTKHILPQILQFAETPETLRNWLAHNGTFAVFNIQEYRHNNVLAELFDKLLANRKALAEAGVDVILNDAALDNHIYLRLNRKAGVLKIDYDQLTHTRKLRLDDVEVPKVRLKEPNLTEIFEEVGLYKYEGFERYVDLFLDVRKNLHYYTGDNSLGSTGDILTPQTVRAIYDQLPDVVKEGMYDIDLITSGEYFDETLFNFINLGSLRHQKDFQEFLPKSMISSLLTSTQMAVKNAHVEVQYLNEWFNGVARINVGQWANSAASKDFVKYLKDNPEFCLAVLVENPKALKGYSTKMLTIKNVADLENAKRLNAVLMTKQQFSKVTGVVNGSMFQRGFLHWWSNLTRIYKSMYLINPGFLLRNYIDSTVKTMVSTGTFGETFKAQSHARRALKEYDVALDNILHMGRINQVKLQELSDLYQVPITEIMSDIGLKVSDLHKEGLDKFIDAAVLHSKYHTAVQDIINMDVNKVFHLENVDFYFEHMTKNFDKDSFLFVHNYIVDSPSGGPTPVLQSYYDGLAKANRSNSAVNGVEVAINNMMDLAMSPNQHIEQIIRLSQHMIQTSRGDSFVTSAYKLAKTHFDYSLKTDVNRAIELFVPFYTFKMRNLEYWAEAATEHPWIARVLADIYTPVFDFDSYDHYEFANNRSLEYQIMSGNIPLGESGLTFKASPSFMDAFNMLADPIGSFKSSMFGPLQTLTDQILENRIVAAGGTVNQSDFENFVNNSMGVSDYSAANASPLKDWSKQLPGVGIALQKIEQAKTYYDRTGNPLSFAPSIFGATSRWDMNRTPRIQYRRGYQKQSKGRKGYSRRSYAKRSYYRKPYLPYKQWDYRPSERRNYVRDVYTNWWHRPKPVKYVNIYEKYYSQKGKRRMDTMLVSTTPENLMYKIREMQRYYRS